MLHWPFVSRGRYNDLKAERDRIDAERRMLLDRLAALGLGGPFYDRPAPPAAAPEQPAETSEDKQAPSPVLMRRRPSEVVAEMTRRAFSDYHKRRNMGAEERELVMRQFDQIDTDVRKGA